MGGPPTTVILGERSFVGVGGRLAEMNPERPGPGAAAMSPPLAERITGMAPAEEQLAVALGRDGLALVDAATLTPGVRLAMPGYAESVSVDGSLAYVADGPGGLRIIDLADRAQPVEIGTAYELHRIMDVVIARGRAYVAAADEGLIVVDVSDPAEPVELGRLFTGGYAFAVDLAGDGLVVVADGWNGVLLVNAADPALPTQIAQVPTTGWAMDLAVEGDRAAAAAGNELLILGVGVGRLDTLARLELPAGRAHAVDIAGEVVALADETSGVSLYDIGAGEPVEIVGFDPLTRASGLAVADDRAFVAALGQGLRMIDVRDPAAPFETAAIVPSDIVEAVAVAGGHVLFTTNPRPGSEYVGSLFTLASSADAVSGDPFAGPLGRGLAVDGNLVFTASEQSVHVLDASGPAPCRLGHIETFDFRTGEGFEANDIAVMGDTAFTAGVYDELHVFDFSDLRQPRLVEARPRMDGLGVGRLLAAGDVLYTIAADPDGPLMAVFDVRDRTQPRIVGRVRLPAETGTQDASGPTLAYGAGYLFVADGLAGLVAIDVSDPGRPVIAATLPLPGNAVGVAVRSEHAYVVTDGGAFFVVSIGAAPSAALQSRPIAFQQQTVAACTVTATDDDGPGTLRDCLSQAGEGTVITFDPSAFPAGESTAIAVASTLIVPSGTTVDATGAGVRIDGDHRVSAGLDLESDCTVRGLFVTGFTEAGVVIHGSGNLIAGNVISDNGYSGVIVGGSGNRLVGNLVGLDPGGRELLGHQSVGLDVGSDNLIGGPATEDRNVIVGRLAIFLKQSHGVSIEGNYIGTDISGTRALSVGEDGAIVALDVGSANNRVAGNIVAGTVRMVDPGSSYNAIVGNRFGIGADGRPLELDAGSGISVSEPLNQIGGTLPGEGNVFNGGIDSSAANVIILGNSLGVDSGGRPTGDGIIRVVRPRTIIGGRADGAGNVVAGLGITLASDGNLVIGNELLEVESPDLAGVRVASGKGNQLVANRVATRIGLAVLVEAGASLTLVVGNDFDDNALHARDDGDGTTWDDGRAGNFWSGFDATDEDADGILDRPREVPPNGIDRFPLARGPVP